jgi:hypothetical protein
MRILKADRPHLEALLTQEADLDAMVDAVFATSVDLALARSWYIILMFTGDTPWLFGPYESEAVAKKHAATLRAGNTEDRGVYQIRRIFRGKDPEGMAPVEEVIGEAVPDEE